MDLIWRGEKPLVIGACDDDANVVEKYVVLPGEEIPARAWELLREAGDDVAALPRRDGEGITNAELKAALKGKQ